MPLSTRAWVQMAASTAVLCIGGPYLVYYLTPSEEELFKRYNPDLQKRSLEGRQERQEAFDQFVNKLKDYSKSDKSIWEVIKEEEVRNKELERQRARDAKVAQAADMERLRQEIRNSSTS